MKKVFFKLATNVLSLFASIVATTLSLFIFANDDFGGSWWSFVVLILGILGPIIACFLFRKKIVYFGFGVVSSYLFFACQVILFAVLKDATYF